MALAYACDKIAYMAEKEKNTGKLVWLLAACCFVLGSTQQYIMGVPDQVAATLNVPLGQVSLLMTAFGLVNAFFAPVVVVATAKYSVRAQLLIGLTFMSVGTAIAAFTSSFALQIVARGIMGVGNGAFVATAYSAAQALAAPERRASAMANVALGFSAASVLAMPIARALRDVISWQVAYAVLLGFALVGFVVIVRAFPRTPASAEEVSIKERLSPLANKSVLLAYAAVAFFFAAYSSFYTYITPFIEATIPQFAQNSSLVLFALGIMSLLGTKGCGWLADCFGIRFTASLAIAGMACGLLLVFATEGMGVASVCALCVFQLLSWMLVPVQNTLLADVAGDGARMAISLSSSFLQLGMAGGAAIAGVAVSTTPYATLPLAALPFVVVAFLFELAVFRAAKRA